MKKHLLFSAIILATGAFLFAQEKIEVSMRVLKDGKLVKDTTYAFDDAKKAKQAVHLFDAISSGKHDVHMSHSDDHHMEFIHEEGKEMKHEKHVVFISEDGKKVQKTIKGDHSWVSKGDGNVKVMVKEFKDGDCEDGEVVIKKEIIVISADEEDEGTWTIKEGKNGEEVMWKKIEGDDGEVIIIKKIKGDGDEEEIEVEVTTKEVKEIQVKAEKKDDISKSKKKKS